MRLKTFPCSGLRPRRACRRLRRRRQRGRRAGPGTLAYQYAADEDNDAALGRQPRADHPHDRVRLRPPRRRREEGKGDDRRPNDGQIVHELVLLKTDANPASLPKKGGKVDESASVGEIADVDAGFTKKATFKLAPGKYAMVCALPDHYENGMYGSLTVK